MIHQYKNNGYNIVMDIASGSVHVVDDVVYDAVALLEPVIGEVMSPVQIPETARKNAEAELSKTYPAEDVKEALDEVQELINAEELYTKDIYQTYVTDFKARKTVVKALCLHIAHDCNLGCKYCFAEEGEYHGRRALMSFEVGKKALDFLVANSGNRHNLEVDFFGGEPLMNFDVVKQLVEYARSIEKQAGKNFRFTLTTNGMLIDDDVIDFANREMSNVVLSLDGRKEVHDRYRVDYAGKGSWETIVPKFQKLVEARKGKGYYMRGTFTHANPDFLEDIKVMLDLGFSELSMEPVVTGAGDPAALTEQDKPTVFEQYEQLAELMLKRDDEGKPFTFYHYMIDLAGGPCIYKRISGCGSGTEYMAVTPWGDLYPCHQFVGDDKFLLGNIWTGVTNTAVRDEFAACNVYARKECRDCWARLYCSGGCAANAYHSTGSVRGIYEYGCDLFRKRMECALMVAVAREIKAAESDEANAPA